MLPSGGRVRSCMSPDGCHRDGQRVESRALNSPCGESLGAGGRVREAIRPGGGRQVSDMNVGRKALSSS